MVITITVERNGLPWQIDCHGIWLQGAYGYPACWAVEHAHVTSFPTVPFSLTRAEESLVIARFEKRFDELDEREY